jgi:DNA-directed RNA polymerase specialized sigma24 family protein
MRTNAGDETEILDGDRVPVAEIRDSVDSLTKPDLARLDLAAQGFSSLCGLDAEDLLQEALTRALEGRRTCKHGTPFVPFICGVMKSLASEEIEARKDGRRPVAVLRNGEPTLPDAPALTPTPEQSAISAIDDRPVLTAIAAGAEGDEQLQILIEGIYDQMRGAKLQELLGVDAKGLATVYKRLSRLLTRSKKKVTS